MKAVVVVLRIALECSAPPQCSKNSKNVLKVYFSLSKNFTISKYFFFEDLSHCADFCDYLGNNRKFLNRFLDFWLIVGPPKLLDIIKPY